MPSRSRPAPATAARFASWIRAGSTSTPPEVSPRGRASGRWPPSPTRTSFSSSWTAWTGCCRKIGASTRVAIDVRVTRGEREYVFVDTAGIRRKGKTEDPAEKLSIISARKAMERARIVIFVFDAAEGITAQDAHILGYAEESGCG